MRGPVVSTGEPLVVRIYTISAELIYKAEASGGNSLDFAWDLGLKNGGKAASGIYIVLVEGKLYRERRLLAVVR